MDSNRFPPGWDEDKIRRVLVHYESQTDEEAVAEDALPFRENGQTMMEVPVALVPLIQELIAQYEAQPAGITGE